MDIKPINEVIGNNPYPGRGIIMGKTLNGKSACVAYFIMGRSENSRNRILGIDKDRVFTRAFDESKVSNPSLIIYNAIRKLNNRLIVSNGDQTDTVYNGLNSDTGFFDSLKTRTHEPDNPNFTPRISGLLTINESDFTYEFSILKSGNEKGSVCNRYLFTYEALPGTGHLIHTYASDGSPLPSFEGEPRAVFIPDCIDTLTDTVWEALNSENRISLYVRYIDLLTNGCTERLINKNH